VGIAVAGFYRPNAFSSHSHEIEHGYSTEGIVNETQTLHECFSW